MSLYKTDDLDLKKYYFPLNYIKPNSYKSILINYKLQLELFFQILEA